MQAPSKPPPPTAPLPTAQPTVTPLTPETGKRNAAVAQLHFGPFVLDLAARELRQGALLVKTTPKMFDLLSLLVRNRHRVVLHAELIQAVWPRVHVSAGVLPQMVRKLRLVLGPGQQPGDAGWIQGSRGVGYRFVGTVDVHGAEGALSALGARPVQPMPSGTRDQALYEQGRDQIRRDDLAGLADTIFALRSPHFGAESSSHRRCLIWADIFESHADRLKGHSSSAWHHLESAQLLLEGLDEPHLQSELHSVRGLYFETFTSEAEALAEFEKAWALALEVDDLRVRAGCAARLAFAFSRTHNWPAFEQWTKSSLQLAAQCSSQSIWLRHTVAAGIGWMEMGNCMADAGRVAQARDAWSKSLRLNESVLGEPASADVSERTRRIARINRYTLLAQLQPDHLPGCVDGLRDCLADEARPGGRIQLQLGLAALLFRAGQHADALVLCQSALAACSNHGIQECRDPLLVLRADVASALGDLAAANAALRELLSWRSEQSAEQAQRLAAITAVRLDTERVLALAEAERERVHELTLENTALRRRTAILEGAAEPDGLSNLASTSRFERHLAHATAAAQARSVPLCVAMIGIDPMQAGHGRLGQVEPEQRLRHTARLLLDICRGGDVVAPLAGGAAFGVVFDALGLARAMAVCQRIRKALLAENATGGVEISASIAVADVTRLPNPGAALAALRVALRAAQAAGGNRVCTAGPRVTA